MRTAARWTWLAGCGVILLWVSAARAAPTTDDVLKSIHENVSSTVDMRKTVPYLLAGAGAIILLVLYNNRKQRKTFPKALNNPGKLAKEICRRIHLKPVEFKQLKMLAEEQDLEHPLTLLLCPSMLGKAMRSANPKIDRAVLKQVVQRLRQSLAASKQ